MTRSKFWLWRHARPFWGGLFVFLGGAEIFLTVKAPLPVVVHVGMQGFIGYLLPIVLALLGILIIVNPAQHLFYSLVAAVLALASWLTSNLGGFVIGLLLALVGSALTFAWSPDKHAPASPAPDLDEAPLVEDEAPPVEHEAPPIEPEPDGTPPVERETVELGLDQSGNAPGVQPETSQSRPRHRRPEPGLLPGE
ncbi:DUF6114 domain-containing protein [Actinoplanes sp. KI2]|uniref:DUF6114 domain-containing protein n=1 Tax=Actinoplanes sp. KI2 TaxID=2983315 RepID=UPI0021D601A8|nr:DUF6114 domain-containing protein [Actinoplanes sp. KI2]MCU7726128.1 DUF6114 domain-containing protein [Actinoplanes sp. KI2]